MIKRPKPFFKKAFLFLVLALLLIIMSSLFFCSEKKDPLPDKKNLIQRINASINIGWGWIHAEKTSIKDIKRHKDQIKVKASYALVINRNEGEISPAEIQRYHDYLPMCREVLIRRTMRCKVEEEIYFTKTAEYGWMPSTISEARPELMPAISAWRKPKK